LLSATSPGSVFQIIGLLKAVPLMRSSIRGLLLSGLLCLPALFAEAQVPTTTEKVAEENAAEKVEKSAETPAAEKPAAETPATDPDTPLGKFQKAEREWQALDKRLSELQSTYTTSTSPAARAEIKKQYQELVDKSNALLPNLRATAEAAYLAEPNAHTNVTRLLVGMVAYDYRRDDYESAMKLAKLLDENKCPEEVLYSVAGAAAFNADDYDTAEKYLTRADKSGKLDRQGKELLAELPAQKEAWAKEQEIRTKEAAAGDKDLLPRVKIETSKGPIVIELFENEAPQTVGNFISLVEAKKYDGLTFHRVLAGFMAQGGDPAGDGSGGPGYEIYCECYKPEYRRHFRGTLSMAHAGKDTGGSQFFLTFRPTTHLNGKHTAFGRVVEGMDVLAKLQRIDPQNPTGVTPDKIVKAEVLRKRDHAYEPTKVK
jgi:cyclophilin family peptidyl-prolyl cis-trans isomerase